MNDTGHAVRGVLLAVAEDCEKEGRDFDPNDEVFEALQGVALFANRDSILVSEAGFMAMAAKAWRLQAGPDSDKT